MAIMRMGLRQSAPPAQAEGDGRAGSGSAQVPAAAPPASDSAVAVKLRFALGAPIAVALCWAAILAWFSAAKTTYVPPLQVNDGASAFALFYVAAQAIERAIEPFTNVVLNTAPAKSHLAAAVAAALTTSSETDGQTAAQKQDELDQLRGERSLLWWAVATIAGMWVSAALGLYFVGAIVKSSTAGLIPVDILITGLVVGGGSKPLHDLISNVQKSANQKADPAETGGSK